MIEIPARLSSAAIKFACLSAAICVSLQTVSVPANGQPSSFAETFAGGGSPAAPAAPQRWNPRDWDVQVHVRSHYEVPGQTLPHDADHGPMCEAPGANGMITHPVTDIEDTVYQCANHVMTSFRADDYGLISLTPPVMVDFSNGEARISFEISTLSNSQRDWPAVVVQPFDESLALPLSDEWPDLNGYGRRAIQFDLRDGVICPVIIRDFERREGSNKFNGTCEWWRNIEESVAPSAQTRQRVEIILSRTRVRISVPALNLVWDDMTIADLGWDQGLVSLIHHSYTPFKDGNGGPNTWHWDTLEISPSKPIFINQADRRWANQDGSVFQFSQPAPQGAHIRGSALGTRLEVSFDDGASWGIAKYQPSRAPLGSQPTWQFWHPVPAGTTRLMVRSGAPSVDWWSSGWVAKDISLFASIPLAGNSQSRSPSVSEPAAPALVRCRTVETTQQEINGTWVDLTQQVTPYQAAGC